jgi:hypothetical protein
MKEGTVNRAPTRKVQKSGTDGTISAALSNAGRLSVLTAVIIQRT